MSEYRETSLYISEGDQAAAEHLVAEFVASNPVPTSHDNISGATIEEQLVDYWQRAPWQAVAEQWDCKFLNETKVRISIAGDGRRVAVVENGYQCADEFGLAVEGASTVVPKTEYLATRASTAG
ncbi:hypothetical protein C3B59_16415 [Cryobacterium zongtaii]|uniref:Uncharacterized protein n=1 Tax=Cryobacterium zongtaii TaxID=1259217 RepID=A0A2S3Z6D9_9MICO|nr:hypothetical protein [Cryobacterium zongtaii]POH60053.1 hypothetical protein C3B59_16415 [Cryobacterium zongtaii]